MRLSRSLNSAAGTWTLVPGYSVAAPIGDVTNGTTNMVAGGGESFEGLKLRSSSRLSGKGLLLESKKDEDGDDTSGEEKEMGKLMAELLELDTIECPAPFAVRFFLELLILDDLEMKDWSLASSSGPSRL